MEDGINQNPEKTPITQIKEEIQMKGTLKDILKVKRHFKNLLIMVYLWCASSFGLYLINFQSKYLDGDFYLNLLLPAIADIPVQILGGLLFHHTGARITLPIFYAMSILGSLGILFFGGNGIILDSILVMMARCGIKVAFDFCYITNSQIFPAIFAGTAFGMCNFGGKLFTILSPMIAEVDKPYPMIIMTVTTSIAFFSSMSLSIPPVNARGSVSLH